MVTSQNSVPADLEIEGCVPPDRNALMEIENDAYDNTDGREGDTRMCV